MKKLIIAAFFLSPVMAALMSHAAGGVNGSFGGLPGSWTAPVVYGATNSIVNVSSLTAIEVTGNPTQASIATASNLANPFYIYLHIENLDGTSDIYCGYNVNTTTYTATTGVEGFRICASSTSINVPISCPSDQYFYLGPYQQFYCRSSAVAKTSPVAVFEWR